MIVDTDGVLQVFFLPRDNHARVWRNGSGPVQTSTVSQMLGDCTDDARDTDSVTSHEDGLFPCRRWHCHRKTQGLGVPSSQVKRVPQFQCSFHLQCPRRALGTSIAITHTKKAGVRRVPLDGAGHHERWPRYAIELPGPHFHSLLSLHQTLPDGRWQSTISKVQQIDRLDWRICHRSRPERHSIIHRGVQGWYDGFDRMDVDVCISVLSDFFSPREGNPFWVPDVDEGRSVLGDATPHTKSIVSWTSPGSTWPSHLLVDDVVATVAMDDAVIADGGRKKVLVTQSSAHVTRTGPCSEYRELHLGE